MNRMLHGSSQLMEDMRYEAIAETIKNFTRMTINDFDFFKSVVFSAFTIP